MERGRNVKRKSRPLTPERKARIRKRMEDARAQTNGSRPAVEVEEEEVSFILELACEALRDSHSKELGGAAKTATEACRGHSERPPELE
jgi:hypothetical protein